MNTLTLKEFRLLLPWFDRDLAVRLMTGDAPARAEAEEAVQRWEAARAKVRARPALRATATTEGLPPQLGLLVREFLASAKLETMPEFAGAELRVVELSSLLTFQAKISTDDVRARFLEAFDGSLESVFRICLPTAARLDPVQVTTEGASARIVSDNPNLRFGGFALSGAALVSTFGFRPPWVQVAEYRGRLFVRNGYHRCWALLNEGVREVVAIVVKVRTLEELGAAESGYVSEAHLLGDRPPMLADFNDPVLYASSREPAPRRVIRITASEGMEVPA